MLAITQEEAAARLGVNAWTVLNWETGATKPAIQFIPALVAFLGYDPERVEAGTLAGGLAAKRRELGLSQRRAARCLAIDPGTWAGSEGGTEIKREAHRRAVEGFLENPGPLQVAQGRGRCCCAVSIDAPAVLPRWRQHARSGARRVSAKGLIRGRFFQALLYSDPISRALKRLIDFHFAID